VQQLLERLRKVQPSLVGEVVPEVVSVGLLQRVLQNLLREEVSIRDLPLILEALGEHGGRTKNAVLLTELARKALSRTITEQHRANDGNIYAITLDPSLEHMLLGQITQSSDSISLSVDPETVSRLGQAAAQAWKSVMERGIDHVIVLCDARLRAGLRTLLQRTVPRLPVVAYDD
jgi:flagellar biosynthesis protein FlhA